MMIKLNMLKCPCGKPFLATDESAFCCMCLSATCSDACHKKYASDRGYCNYSMFLTPDQSKLNNGSGCRCISKIHYEKSLIGDMLSLMKGPRFATFIKAINNCILISRGYFQFGQPLLQTLSAMECIDADPIKSVNPKRRCNCQCPKCTENTFHPFHVCSDETQIQ